MNCSCHFALDTRAMALRLSVHCHGNVHFGADERGRHKPFGGSASFQRHLAQQFYAETLHRTSIAVHDAAESCAVQASRNAVVNFCRLCAAELPCRLMLELRKMCSRDHSKPLALPMAVPCY
ncbi:hypothetical protein DVH05_018843 [Phytophthora capsici]|nr:hypothetical protein DVH05_018843 [Phytophthora capsici]